MKPRSYILAAVVLALVMLFIVVVPAGAGTTRTPFTAFACTDQITPGVDRLDGQVYHMTGDVHEAHVLSVNTMVAGKATGTISYKLNLLIGLLTGTANYDIAPDAYQGGWSGHGSFLIYGKGANPFTSNIVLFGIGDLKGYELHMDSVPVPPNVPIPTECEYALQVNYWEGYILDPAGE